MLLYILIQGSERSDEVSLPLTSNLQPIAAPPRKNDMMKAVQQVRYLLGDLKECDGTHSERNARRVPTRRNQHEHRTKTRTSVSYQYPIGIPIVSLWSEIRREKRCWQRRNGRFIDTKINCKYFPAVCSHTNRLAIDYQLPHPAPPDVSPCQEGTCIIGVVTMWFRQIQRTFDKQFYFIISLFQRTLFTDKSQRQKGSHKTDR